MVLVRKPPLVTVHWSHPSAEAKRPVPPVHEQLTTTTTERHPIGPKNEPSGEPQLEHVPVGCLVVDRTRP